MTDLRQHYPSLQAAVASIAQLRDGAMHGHPLAIQQLRKVAPQIARRLPPGTPSRWLGLPDVVSTVIQNPAPGQARWTVHLARADDTHACHVGIIRNVAGELQATEASSLREMRRTHDLDQDPALTVRAILEVIAPGLDYRTLHQLRVTEQRSPADIAQELGLTENVAREHLRCHGLLQYRRAEVIHPDDLLPPDPTGLLAADAALPNPQLHGSSGPSEATDIRRDQQNLLARDVAGPQL